MLFDFFAPSTIFHQTTVAQINKIHEVMANTEKKSVTTIRGALSREDTRVVMQVAHNGRIESREAHERVAIMLGLTYAKPGNKRSDLVAPPVMEYVEKLLHQTYPSTRCDIRRSVRYVCSCSEELMFEVEDMIDFEVETPTELMWIRLCKQNDIDTFQWSWDWMCLRDKACGIGKKPSMIACEYPVPTEVNPEPDVAAGMKFVSAYENMEVCMLIFRGLRIISDSIKTFTYGYEDDLEKTETEEKLEEINSAIESLTRSISKQEQELRMYRKLRNFYVSGSRPNSKLSLAAVTETSK